MTNPITTSATSEQTAIQQAMHGDLDAFNELVLTYQHLAYSVAYRTLQDEDAAADAVQESFIKAFRALNTFQGGSFKSWIIRIVVNTCYDALRSQQRRRTDSLDDLTADDEFMPQLVDKQESPEQIVERMELHALIERGVAALPARATPGSDPVRHSRLRI